MKTRVVTGVVLVALIFRRHLAGRLVAARRGAACCMLLSMHEMYAAYRHKGLRPVPCGAGDWRRLLLLRALLLPGDRVMEAAVVADGAAGGRGRGRDRAARAAWTGRACRRRFCR